ncbi:sugar phosphate isomerase/epimerase family protein [Haloarcula onubensis]|uniref:TIM barrel protein n=1 Tax=Haloarcula onubensis TaxID=2950539 RepID=A0ABU2FUX1_9EURY|nr:TIM barrel protein [Halomicroarcula sp. S3CR25-11]MDS0284564.1 TIM barrel protein [Halomicroarcula sp. S3CR25-11]
MVRPALQLYSVRDAHQPLVELLPRIREAGYEGVEFASPPERDCERLSSALSDAGLEVVGMHVRLQELRDGRAEILESCRALGCADVIVAHVSPSHFRTRSRVHALAQELDAQAAALAEAGVSLHYHNQCFEFQSVDVGPLVDAASAVCNPSPRPRLSGAGDAETLRRYRRMAGTAGERILDALGGPPPADSFEETGLATLLAETDDALAVEPDLGNVRAAGFDPERVLARATDRTRLVHVKDEFVSSAGPYPEERPAPLGSGDVDVEGAVAAADAAGATWVVMENDDPATPLGPIANGREVFESAGV